MSCTKSQPAACSHIVDAAPGYATQGIARVKRRADAPFQPAPTISTYRPAATVPATLYASRDARAPHQAFRQYRTNLKY